MAGQQRLIEQGLAHHHAGRFKDAAAIYRRVLQIDPRHGDAFSLLSQALDSAGDADGAVEAARNAVRVHPQGVMERRRLSKLLMLLGLCSESVEVWRDYAARTNGSLEAVVALSRQLAAVRRGDEAIQVIEEAIVKSPDEPVLRIEAARVCERLSRVERAAEHMARVGPPLVESPDCQVVLARLELARGDAAAARTRLERAAATPQGANSAELINNLAQLLDRAKKYDAAFEAAERARGLAFEALPASLKDAVYVDELVRQTLAFTKDELSSWPAMAAAGAGGKHWQLPAGVSAAPVFVVGFPRSGTTLVEQMLGAHPNMVVSDELPILRLTWQRLFRRYRPGGVYPKDLSRITTEQAAQARRWFLELAYANLPLADRAGVRPRIVDKQPYTTIELCFVRMIFPESPVIYVMRDPRDTVASVMLQAFARSVGPLYTLEGAARLYDQFARVWEHSRSILDLKTMVVRYEELVADAEGQARKMIEFVGEPWDEAVAKYHAPEQRRYVVTPSYADVSKPVYTRAKGRWKNYQRQLAPVLPVLEPWVKAAGYE